jgi:hypothetical protein
LSGVASSIAARSSSIVATAWPPGAIGGSSGAGELGGGGRGAGGAGGGTLGGASGRLGSGWLGGLGGASGLSEATQQPLQSQPISSIVLQVKPP